MDAKELEELGNGEKYFEKSKFFLPQNMADNLFNLVEKVTHSCLLLAIESDEKEIKIQIISEIWKLVNTLEGEKLIWRVFDSEDHFCSVIRSWLLDDKIPIGPVLGLLFIPKENEEVLNLRNNLVSILSETRLKEAVTEAINLSNWEKSTSLQCWLMSDSIKKTLCDYIIDFLSKDLEDSSEKSKSCLTSVMKNVYVIGSSTISEMLEKVIILIQTEEKIDCELVRILLEAIFDNEEKAFFGKEHCEVVFQLLVIIFEKLLITDFTDVFNVWNKGISVMASGNGLNSQLFSEFTEKCAVSVKSFLQTRKFKNVDYIKNACTITHSFIVSSVSSEENTKKKADAALKLAEDFLYVILKNAKETWETNIEEVCCHTEEIFGNIPSSFESTENYCFHINGKWDPLFNINVSQYTESIIFSVELICLLLDIFNDLRESYFNENDPLLTPIELNSLSTYLLDYTFSLSLLRTLSKYFSSTPELYYSKDVIPKLEEDLKELVQLLSAEKHEDMIDIAKTRFEEKVSLWGHSLRLLCDEFTDKEVPNLYTRSKKDLSAADIPITAEDICFIRLSIENKFPSKVETEAVVDMMKKINHKDFKQQVSLTFDKNLKDSKAKDLIISGEVARFFVKLIKDYSDIIENEVWDFIIVALASWTQSIGKTFTSKYYKEFLGFFMSVSDLFITFSEFIKESKCAEAEKLKKEWSDVFSLDAYRSISLSWKLLAEKSSTSNLAPISLLHIEKLCDVMNTVMENGTFLPPSLEKSCIMDWVKTCGALIVSSCPSVQMTSYKILVHISPKMLDIDFGLDENNFIDKLSYSVLKEPFLTTQTVVNTLINEYRLGIICCVEPFTDAYIYSRAYMMLWLVLLKICEIGDPQLKYLYILWIKENNLLPIVMNSLLRLMPESVIDCHEVNVKKSQELFSSAPIFSNDSWTSHKLAHLCCWVYCSLLRTLPALARQWMADADPKMAAMIDKLTTTFVSPILSSEEMEYIRCQNKKFDNMKIITLPSAREVVAAYTVEDCTTELIIQLTQNHPLTPPKVDISKVMVSTSKIRMLLKQLTIFLSLQNGNIWDGILLWKNNLDRKFEGIEECYICFAILHNSNHQLPKLSCQTCKKKFHTICLYKWFTTSHKSTCPICRNLF